MSAPKSSGTLDPISLHGFQPWGPRWLWNTRSGISGRRRRKTGRAQKVCLSAEPVCFTRPSWKPPNTFSFISLTTQGELGALPDLKKIRFLGVKVWVLGIYLAVSTLKAKTNKILLLFVLKPCMFSESKEDMCHHFPSIYTLPGRWEGTGTRTNQDISFSCVEIYHSHGLDYF